MTILYFTSTGNCLSIAKKLDGQLLSIPQMIKQNRYDFTDDEIGIIFPVHSFGVPKIVKNFLTKANIKANYTFAIATYGNISGPTLINLKKESLKEGLTFNYMNQILMVDNYLPMFDIDDQLKQEKYIEQNTEKIISDILSKKENTPKNSYILGPLVKMLEPTISKLSSPKTAKSFAVTNKCTMCGICTKVCPNKNISLNDQVLFASNCIVCLGCVHHCPSNAIHIKKEKSNTRFINPNVTLKEIIYANNQQ